MWFDRPGESSPEKNNSVTEFGKHTSVVIITALVFSYNSENSV